MDDHKDKPSDSSGKLISFPNGEKIPVSEMGMDYVVDQSGMVPTPEVIDPQSINREYREREVYVESQALTQAALVRAPVAEIVDTVINEIIEELGHLKFERRKAAKEGKNTANYTISRIQSLRQLSDVLLKKLDSVKSDGVDVKSPKFKAVLRLWMEFVYDSMQKCGISDDLIDLVFKQIEADMKDWEQKLNETVG
jgi:hypothetical protein